MLAVVFVFVFVFVLVCLLGGYPIPFFEFLHRGAVIPPLLPQIFFIARSVGEWSGIKGSESG